MGQAITSKTVVGCAGKETELCGFVADAQAGSQEAFKKLYDLFNRKVFNLAYRMLGDYGLAQDVTQEIFLKVYEKIGSYRFESSFNTWLYRLAMNVLIDKHRGSSAKMRAAGVEVQLMAGAGVADLSAPSAEDQYRKKEIAEAVRRAIAELKPKHKSVIVLKDLEGLSYPEIAAILKCSEGTVASRLNKARRLLKRKLQHLKGRI